MFHIEKSQVLDAFKFRSACRSYDPNKKISDKDFAYILELARLSPSSVGSEPWQFVVVQNNELRQKLKPISWGMATQVDDCSHLVVILAKKNARYDTPFFENVMDRRGLEGEARQKALGIYKKFQEQDIAITDSERTLFDWARAQTYIALGNMMSGSALIGIDSCPIEGFDYKAVNDLLVNEGVFDPDEWGVSVMVTFGYRNKDISRKSRRPISDVVTWIK